MQCFRVVVVVVGVLVTFLLNCVQAVVVCVFPCIFVEFCFCLPVECSATDG